MDRNREAKRGIMQPMNGGISRRRQRTSSLRDSPEEDGGMELQETSRLRDRRNKKDRDRERSSRSKRRRGDRVLHASNRDEGEESSDESVDEEEEDEDESVSAGVRQPPPSSSLPLNHHSRKNFAVKVASSMPSWKVADEMIGVSVPRKARSASVKRSHECSLSGSVGGGAEQIHRQPSTSPARPNPGSTAAPISPSSSNASVRKMKQISGNKHRPPKTGKSPSSIQEDIEIEVAEVLYGLTRQFHKPDSKDTNGSTNEVKSRVSSPSSFSPPPLTSQSSVLPTLNSGSSGAPLATIPPKRKRPRPVKFEDESPTSSPNLLAVPSTSISSTSRMDGEQPTKVEVISPKLEKNRPTLAADNGGAPLDSSLSQIIGMPPEVLQVCTKTDNNIVPELKPLVPESDAPRQIENKGETSSAAKEHSRVELNTDRDEAATPKDSAAVHVEKFRIDLMAPPPPGKSSSDTEGLSEHAKNHKPSVEIGPQDPKADDMKIDEGRVERSRKQDALEFFQEEKMEEKTMQEDFELKKQQVFKERIVDLQLDIEKQENNGLVTKQLVQKQQSKSTITELKPDKPVQAASLSLPVAVAGWPGVLPPFGYMGQVPSVQAVVPMDGSPRSSKSMQLPPFLPPPLRPKRCATHCYIAQNIQYHLQLARISSFWPPVAGTAPIYGAKPYNLNVMPPSESAILGNHLPGGFPGRSLQDKGVPVVANFSGHSSKDKNSVAGTFVDMTPQRKPLVLQGPQAGSTSNMVHAPAFIFPLNQQQAAAAASTRSAAVKSTTGVSNLPPSSAPNSTVVSPGSAAASATTVSFNYPNLPQSEAQYLAILQNNAYPFPIPPHGGVPLPYRGGSHAQFPFFNGSFYTSQMLHPSQLQQQQQQPPQPQLQSQQPPPPTQNGHQNTSTSSGSSSSQKQSQQPQQRVLGAGSAHGLPASKQRLLPHQARHLETETGGEDSPSTADSRVSQSQKGINGHNFAMPSHPQNFGLMSAAKAPASGAVNHNEKHQQLSQQQQQSMKVELMPSQPFAMSFASFNGGGASAPSGLDFSSLAQNHAVFSLPEAARQYQMAAAAAAAAAQAVQHKKNHHRITEDGKPTVDSMPVNVPVEERKVFPAEKAPGSISQHTLAFSRPDSNLPMSTILGNSVIDSSARTLNLNPGTVNGTRPSNRSSSATPTIGAVTAAPNTSSAQQHHHQQHLQLVQLQKQQKQQQQQLQQQQLTEQQLQQQQQQQLQRLGFRTKSASSSNNASVYSDRSTPASTGTKFPNAGFPQTLIQGSIPNQSPQWKNSARTMTSAPCTTPPPPSPVKSHLPQQPSRNTQQNVSTSGHHSQISFGVNSLKAAATGQQFSAVNNNPSSPSATAAVGSPQTSASKSTGGSPRASTGSKQGPPPPTLPFQQQQQPPSKNSPSSSSRKSSPVSNRNSSSILGPPHITSTSSSTTKQQQQQQQKQPYPQAQFFFSGGYVQGQSFQPNPSAAFFQRRFSEQQQLTPQQQQQQQQQQHSNSPSGSSGMLSLCSPVLTMAGATTTSDPTKAVAAANSLNGMPPAGILHAAQFAAGQAGGGPRPLMSASGFPYIHAMPSVSVKPQEQKPAAGNDNLHACWQPEKR